MNCTILGQWIPWEHSVRPECSLLVIPTVRSRRNHVRAERSTRKHTGNALLDGDGDTEEEAAEESASSGLRNLCRRIVDWVSRKGNRGEASACSFTELINHHLQFLRED